MFPQEFYLMSLHLFLEKGAKFTPWKFRKWFKYFLLKPSFFLLINSFINSFSHDSVQDIEVCLLMILLYFQTFLKLSISSATFSDNELLLT